MSLQMNPRAFMQVKHLPFVKINFSMDPLDTLKYVHQLLLLEMAMIYYTSERGQPVLVGKSIFIKY